MIGAITELINTNLFTYYFAGIFIAFSFVVVGYMIRKFGKS